jgi:hypothetical protein
VVSHVLGVVDPVATQADPVIVAGYDELSVGDVLALCVLVCVLQIRAVYASAE